MRKVVFWIGWMGIGGCLRDPDPGGQEGEEIRTDNVATEDAGEVPDDGAGDTDTGSVGGGDEAMFADWTGTLRVERGLGLEPGARDCQLAWSMSGEIADVDCESCVAVFDVEHTLDAAASIGLDACTDLPERFVRTYALAMGEGEAAEVWIWSDATGLQPYALGRVAEGVLSWSVGLVDVPAIADDGTVTYRTDVEQGTVSLE